MTGPVQAMARDRAAEPAARTDRVLGIRISPIGRRRLINFRANGRGYWSMWIFLALFVGSMFADFIANDKPLLVKFDGGYYLPILRSYPETAFGGEFETEAEYRDPFVIDLIEEQGWMVWPLIPFSFDTINYDLPQPAPSPPDRVDWLGTDDQGRDVVARVIHGFRISVLFGVLLTILGSIVGIGAGAAQVFFGGWLYLSFQRFMEIWGSMPVLFLLIIMASIITPGFWTIFSLMMLFAWMSLVAVVRAEFLRARNFDYVRAARALGQPDRVIMFKHVLPNAMVATVTFLPFNLVGAVTLLTSLDFLGFGLPPGSPSLGEMVNQAKGNLQAPWLAFTAFFTLFTMLVLVIFMGEAVRDAFDPRKATGPVGGVDVAPDPELADKPDAEAAAE